MFILYFLKLFLIFNIVLVSLYFIGNILNQKFLYQNNSEFNFFNKVLLNVFTAFLLIASITAIIYTKGKTLQLITVLFLIAWFFLNKKNESPLFSDSSSSVNIKTKAITITSLTIFSSLLLFFQNGFPSNSYNINVHFDYYYLAKLSGKLLDVGVENYGILLNQYKEMTSLSLYHYTDLWFNGLIAKIFFLNESESLLFITYPLLLFLSLIGFVGVLYKVWNRSMVQLILMILVMVYGIAILLPFQNFPLFRQAAGAYYGLLGADCYYTKILILFPCLLIAFLCLEKKSLSFFSIWVVIAMVCYNTTIPAFTGGLGALILFEVLKTKINKNKNYSADLKFSILTISVFIGAILLFLVLFIDKEKTNIEISILPLRSIIILTIEYLISPYLIYWVIALLILIVFMKKELKSYLFFIIIFVVGSQLSGIVYILLNYHVIDKNQVLDSSIPVLMLLIGVYYFKIIRIDNKYSKWAFFIVLLISTLLNFNRTYKSNSPLVKNTNYSNVFKEQISSIINTHHTKVIWVTISSNPSNLWDYNYMTPGCFILNSKNAEFPLDISPYLMEKNVEFCSFGRNMSFPVCAKILKNGNALNEVISLLVKTKTDYIFVENNTRIPVMLSEKMTLIVKDARSQDAFYSFKP